MINASVNRRTALISVLLLALLCLGTMALPVSAADAANRQQAIDMALDQNGGDGKVLGVKVENDRNGQTVYAIKILSNGRIRVIRIPQAE